MYNQLIHNWTTFIVASILLYEKDALRNKTKRKTQDKMEGPSAYWHEGDEDPVYPR
jgi:hypothetical protein